MNINQELGLKYKYVFKDENNQKVNEVFDLIFSKIENMGFKKNNIIDNGFKKS